MANPIVPQLKTTAEIVEPLLTNPSPRLDDYRNNDEILTSKIWYGQLAFLGYSPEKISAYDFLKIYAENKLIDAELIARTRRILQAAKPETRGTAFKDRQDKGKETRKDIPLS